MSIQNEIERLRFAVQNAYSSVQKMGGTLPSASNRTIENLSAAIESIPKNQRFYFPIETEVDN